VALVQRSKFIECEYEIRLFSDRAHQRGAAVDSIAEQRGSVSIGLARTTIHVGLFVVASYLATLAGNGLIVMRQMNDLLYSL
jgi:hypothetical protein